MPCQRDCLIWKAKIFFPLWFLGVFGSHFLHGQVENWPSTSQEVQENLGTEDTQPSHKIYLGVGFPEYDSSDSTTSNQKIRTVYDYNEWFIHPEKGYLGNQGSDTGGFYIHYHPYLHAEGEDQFHWLAKNVEGIDKNFSLTINITPRVDDLEIYISDVADGEDLNNTSETILLTFEEEQNHVATIEIFDPDPSKLYNNSDDYPSVRLLQNDTAQNDKDLFEITRDTGPTLNETDKNRNGWSWIYKISYKDTPPNFDSFDGDKYLLVLEIQDIVDGFDAQQWDVEIELIDVPESPNLLRLDGNQSGLANIFSDGLTYPTTDDDPTTFEYSLIEGENLEIEVPFHIESTNGKNLQIMYMVSPQRIFDEETNEPDYPILETITTTSAETNSKIELEEGEYLDLSDDNYSGHLTIGFPIEDSFSRETTYSFYVIDDTRQGPLKGGSNGSQDVPFFTAKIEVLNDYSDQIVVQLLTPDNDRTELIFDSETEVSSESLPIIPSTTYENEIELIVDFEVTDPDSYPTADLRLDNNSNDRDGARIVYEMSWIDENDNESYTRGNPSDVFEITEDGLLFYKNEMDYESLVASGENIFKLKVKVKDSFQTSVPGSHTLTDVELYLQIILDDLPEPPQIVDQRKKVTSLPTFEISLDEDTSWSWDKSDRDDNNQTIFLAAKDFDREGTSGFALPFWEVTLPSLYGTVDLRPQENITDEDDGGETINYDITYGTDVVIPTSLTFTPNPNFSGSTSFELSYGNSENDDNIKFNVTVNPLPDLPTLTGIFNNRPIPDQIDSTIDVLPDKFTYLDLNFSEADGLEYVLEFEDTQDNDEITILDAASSLDSDLFAIEEVEASGNARKIILTTIDDLDFEFPTDSDGDNVYSITILVGDENSPAPSAYTFHFSLVDSDEPPVFEVAGQDIITTDTKSRFTFDSNLIVAEEQKIVLSEIRVFDPEEEFLEIDPNDEEALEFRWKIEKKYDYELFELNTTAGREVTLEFVEGGVPNWDEGGENIFLMVSLQVKDTGVPQGISYLEVPIEIINANDPPHFIQTQVVIDENVDLVIADLNDYVIDQDDHDIEFRVVGSEMPLEFNRIIGSELTLKKPLDYESLEEGESYWVEIEAEDEKGLLGNHNIEISVLDVEEAPTAYRRTDSSFADEIDSIPLSLFEDSTLIIDEILFFDADDTSRNSNNLNYYIDGSLLGTFTDEERGTIKHLGDGNFSYTPPPDFFTVLGEVVSFDLNISDGISSSLFTFNFTIEDVSDPPKINITLNPEISFFDAEDSSTIINNEGNLVIATLEADDSMDKFPSNSFFWELDGFDRSLFKLEPDNTKTVTLLWNLGGEYPNYSIPPHNPDRGIQELPLHAYDLSLIVYGGTGQTEENKNEKKINIVVGDLPSQAPLFNPLNFEKFLEESNVTTTLVGEVSAYDPDAQEGVFTGNPIRYEIKTVGTAYSDHQFFDVDKFNTVPLDPDKPGGKIYFLDPSPDYESLLNRASGPKFTIEVVASEYNASTGEPILELDSDQKVQTSKIITIEVENRVEEPFFDQSNDQNFSLIEGDSVRFLIYGDTDDYSKTLNIELTSNENYDNGMFDLVTVDSDLDYPVVGQLSFKEFSDLKNFPDLESPRDLNKDNIYEIEVEIRSRIDPEVFSTQVFRVEVLDKDYPFSLPQSKIIRVPENQLFIQKIEIIDDELEGTYPELLSFSEKGSFYFSNIYPGADDKAHYFSPRIERISYNSEYSDPRSVVAADLNNDGSSDAVTLYQQQVKVSQNFGFGTFQNDLYTKFLSHQNNTLSNYPREIAVGDFDLNGFKDLIVSYYDESLDGCLYIFTNTDFSFSPYRIELPDLINAPSSLLAMDGDGDHDLDLFVADSKNNSVGWFRNDGKASFDFVDYLDLDGSDLRIQSPSYLRALKLGDFESSISTDLYAKSDLLIGASDKIFLAENDGTGEFSVREVINLKTPSGQEKRRISNISLSDFNEDGLTDLVFLGNGSSNELYYALQKRSGDWLGQHQHLKWENDALISSFNVFHVMDGGTLSQHLVVGTENPPLLYQFTPPSIINDGSGILFDFQSAEFIQPDLDPELSVLSLELADINIAYNYFDFEIRSGAFDHEVFDSERLKSEGLLFFKNPRDFENPKFGTDNLYEVEIVASKKNRSTGELQEIAKIIKIKVEDENEAPQFLDNPNLEVRENHLHVLELDVANPEFEIEELNFSILPSQDSSYFSIGQKSGILGFNERLRFEDKQEFQITVQVTEDKEVNSLSSVQVFTINLIDGYELPVIQNKEVSFQLVEDQLNPLILKFEDFNVTDDPSNLDPGIKAVELLQGPSHGFADLNFSLSESKGEIVGEFHYFPDANYSGTDQLILEFINSQGLPNEMILKFDIEHQEDPPIVLLPLEMKHPEGDLNITKLVAYDSDPGDINSLIWKLANPDDPHFEIIGQDNLVFKFNPDYEKHAKQFFIANLVVSDGEFEVPHSLTIQISDVSDTPPKTILSRVEVNYFRIDEGTKLIKNLEITDSDGPADRPTARVIAGTDSSFFTISDKNGSYELRVRSDTELSFEEPLDINLDNIYEFKVHITDGLLPLEYLVFVEIEDLDENPPFFTTKSSNGEVLESVRFEVLENQSFVGVITAEDQERGKDRLTFKISGGEDKELFVLNQKSGELIFKSPPNYEARTNEVAGTLIERPYEIVVEVTDGKFVTNQSISVLLMDENDLPEISLKNFSLLEDSLLSQNLEVSDEDGESHLIQVVIKDRPFHGSLSFNEKDRTFVYTPEKDYFGTDSFSLLLTDDQSESITERIDLEILSVNDKPNALDDFVYYFSHEGNETVPLEFSVSSNDHTGVDPKTEFVNYGFNILSIPDTGSLQKTLTQGTFVFLPDENTTLGPEEFDYMILDQDLNDTAQSTIWVATLPDLPQWISLRNFGLFYHQLPEENNAWIYHQKMGWVYVSEFSDIYEATWIWHELIGWFWTGDWNADQSRSRWLYSDATETWMHWEGGIREQQSWFTRDYEDNIYDEDFFVRLIIRNEIIEILPDISGLVSYLGSSNYFTRADIVRIIGELNRFRESSTLDSILEYKLPY